MEMKLNLRKPRGTGLFANEGSAHQVQELQVALILVKDVVDDLLLGVAHQIVVLTALPQVHLGTVVAAIVELF